MGDISLDKGISEGPKPQWKNFVFLYSENLLIPLVFVNMLLFILPLTSRSALSLIDILEGGGGFG